MKISTRRWLRGLATSWTAHTGTYLAVLGYLQTQNGLIEKYIGKDSMGLVMMLFGLLIVVLRVKTTESLESKGTR
jgi:hypothetical protein